MRKALSVIILVLSTISLVFNIALLISDKKEQ